MSFFFVSWFKNDSTPCEDVELFDDFEFVDFASFYGFVSQVQENLPGNEKRLSIHKQIVGLKTNKDKKEINNMIFALELDISEMGKHIFRAQFISR